jgi:hypothetical protein
MARVSTIAGEDCTMKAVTPKQLELTAGKSREELLLATAPHIDPESPALKADQEKLDKIELAEAAGAVLGSGYAFREEVAEEDFDWNTDDSVILKEQRATAVYHNKLGELIIRQRAAWDDDRDAFVYVMPENIVAFLEGAAKRARE